MKFMTLICFLSVLIFSFAGITKATRQSGSSANLFLATENGDVEALAKLSANTNWNEVNAAGETALIRAVAQRQKAFVQALLKKTKLKVNSRDKAGNTALLYAVSNNDKDLALPLIHAGAALDLLYGAKKENILFEVARLGASEIGDQIIKRQKSLLNQANVDGKTPVFVAIESDQHKLALHLIEQGASTKQVSKSGQTLLDTARANAVEESSPLFKKLKESH